MSYEERQWKLKKTLREKTYLGKNKSSRRNASMTYCDSFTVLLSQAIPVTLVTKALESTNWPRCLGKVTLKPRRTWSWQVFSLLPLNFETPKRKKLHDDKQS